MKIAPIIIALKAAQARGSELTYRLIHTGQHYDPALTRLLDGQWKDGEIPEKWGVTLAERIVAELERLSTDGFQN